MCLHFVAVVFFFKQKTAYEMRISDWSSDVCSSDLFCSTVGSRQIVVGDAAEAERQIGDQMLGGEHFQDGQIGDGRQGVRAELQGCRAGPGSLERSEEHTSELKSLMRISYAVFCLKNKKQKR